MVRSGVGCECRVTQKRLRRQKFFLHLATSALCVDTEGKTKQIRGLQDVCVFSWALAVLLSLVFSR